MIGGDLAIGVYTDPIQENLVKPYRLAKVLNQTSVFLSGLGEIGADLKSKGLACIKRVSTEILLK